MTKTAPDKRERLFVFVNSHLFRKCGSNQDDAVDCRSVLQRLLFTSAHEHPSFVVSTPFRYPFLCNQKGVLSQASHRGIR